LTVLDSQHGSLHVLSHHLLLQRHPLLHLHLVCGKKLLLLGHHQLLLGHQLLLLGHLLRLVNHT
jgi:hypothetical protein